MPARVEIIEIDEPIPYLFVEHIGPYGQINPAFIGLFAVEGVSELAASPLRLISVRLDDPDVVAASDLRSNAGLVVHSGAQVPMGVQMGTIPNGRFARCVSVGPYSGVKDSWKFLYSVWLPHSGERIQRDIPGFEIYPNRTFEVASEDLVTEIYVALQS